MYVDRDFLVTGEMSAIRENGATSGLGVIAVFGYDYLGRRTSLTRGNGTVTTYAYDPASRLGQLAQDVAGTTLDLTLGFTYNAAGQIATHTRSNDLYSWTGTPAGTTDSTVNGLNQVTQSGSSAVTHDLRGNIVTHGSRGYVYSSENLLTSSSDPGGTEDYGYDPLLRLHRVVWGTTVRNYLWDGGDMLVHYVNGALRARIVYGPGENEPLYQINSQGGRTWYLPDERGSIIAGANSSGTFSTVTTFDEYGNYSRAAFNHGFTGALWMGTGLYMRARVYDPSLGRFLQTDPIGYGDGMNMYAYVRGDPVNFVDPAGMSAVWASRLELKRSDGPGAGGGVRYGPSSGGSSGGGMRDNDGNIRDAVASAALWEREAWFENKESGERLSDWQYTGRYVLNGAWGYLPAVQGISAQEVREARGRVLLGEMTVPQGNSLLAALPSVPSDGYRNVAVAYRFMGPPVGRGASFIVPTMAVVNLRFDNTQRFFSLGTRSLVGSMGRWNSQTVTLPLGTNRITGYPMPTTPETLIRIYGVR